MTSISASAVLAASLLLLNCKPISNNPAATDAETKQVVKKIGHRSPWDLTTDLIGPIADGHDVGLLMIECVTQEEYKALRTFLSEHNNSLSQDSSPVALNVLIAHLKAKNSQNSLKRSCIPVVPKVITRENIPAFMDVAYQMVDEYQRNIEIYSPKSASGYGWVGITANNACVLAGAVAGFFVGGTIGGGVTAVFGVNVGGASAAYASCGEALKNAVTAVQDDVAATKERLAEKLKKFQSLEATSPTEGYEVGHYEHSVGLMARAVKKVTDYEGPIQRVFFDFP